MKITPTELKETKSFFQSQGYSRKFRKDVHTLLNYGYKEVKPTLTSETQEPTITGRIAEAIDKGLQELGLLPDEVLKPHYVVIPEFSKIQFSDLKNEKDFFLRLDIVILNNQKRPYKKYIVEGKRLKKENFIDAIKKYCDHGIIRFVEEIYASDIPEAIMAGFWQDEDLKHWFDELVQKFDDDEIKMCVEEKLKPIKIIPEILHEWYSIHRRKSGSKILLFHIFLDCL